jgi:hypothetical protein
MEAEGSLPCSQKPTNSKPLCNICDKPVFLQLWVVSPSTNDHNGGQSLSAIRGCLFNIFAATLNMLWPSPSSTTRGHAMPWWQGPAQYAEFLTEYLLTKWQSHCLHILFIGLRPTFRTWLEGSKQTYKINFFFSSSLWFLFSPFPFFPWHSSTQHWKMIYIEVLKTEANHRNKVLR